MVGQSELDSKMSCRSLNVASRAARSFAKKKGEGEMKYTWKVIHEVVGKLEGALNALQKDGFEVYRILPAGEMGTTLEMGATFVVVGRKEAVTATPVR